MIFYVVFKKLHDTRNSHNALKAKIKYKDSQICRFRDEIKNKITNEQYELIENEIMNVPGTVVSNIFIFLFSP